MIASICCCTVISRLSLVPSAMDHSVSFGLTNRVSRSFETLVSRDRSFDSSTEEPDPAREIFTTLLVFDFPSDRARRMVSSGS